MEAGYLIATDWTRAGERRTDFVKHEKEVMARKLHTYLLISCCREMPGDGRVTSAASTATTGASTTGEDAVPTLYRRMRRAELRALLCDASLLFRLSDGVYGAWRDVSGDWLGELCVYTEWMAESGLGLAGSNVVFERTSSGECLALDGKALPPPPPPGSLPTPTGGSSYFRFITSGRPAFFDDVGMLEALPRPVTLYASPGLISGSPASGLISNRFGSGELLELLLPVLLPPLCGFRIDATDTSPPCVERLKPTPPASLELAVSASGSVMPGPDTGVPVSSSRFGTTIATGDGSIGAITSLPPAELQLEFSLSTSIGSSGSDSSPSQDMGRGRLLLALRSSRMLTPPPFVSSTAVAAAVFSMFDSSVSDSSDSSIFGTRQFVRSGVQQHTFLYRTTTRAGGGGGGGGGVDRKEDLALIIALQTAGEPLSWKKKGISIGTITWEAHITVN
uniref:Uncharacterized protein n=1 Tax=Anopheles farauti TaxID=69004 RepID=A0A182Q4T7_9DIPT